MIPNLRLLGRLDFLLIPLFCMVVRLHSVRGGETVAILLSMFQVAVEEYHALQILAALFVVNVGVGVILCLFRY